MSRSETRTGARLDVAFAARAAALLLSLSAPACGLILELPDPNFDPEIGLLSDAGMNADGAGSSADAGAGVGSACSPQASETGPCGRCGTRSHQCLDDGAGHSTWGEWSACTGERTGPDACDPTQSYTSVTCGNCGTQSRACNLDCTMSYANCIEPTFGGTPACAAGTKQFMVGASCTGENAGRSRTCSKTCEWSSYGSCETFTIDTGSVFIATGADHACMILPSGSVGCWGNNSYGQLGDGTRTSANRAVEVSGIANAIRVAAGTHFSCVVLWSGTVKCWGDSASNVLGNGVSGPSSTPVDVYNVTNATALAAGGDHACALVSGGAIECWGSNLYGQLGTGSPTVAQMPSAVPGISGATAIAAGSHHTCAIVSGAVKCWGSNASGQLGTGSTTDALTPTPVPGLTGVVAIAAGGEHTCAVLDAGGTKCWGSNTFGQLGNGGVALASSTPVDVESLSGALSVSAGASHSCVITGGGIVRCWGANADGELGNGATAPSVTAPDIVQGIAAATDVAAGSNFTCARLAAGDAKCWGDNGSQELGSGGTTQDSAVPLAVDLSP